jgi:hypothetical protein
MSRGAAVAAAVVLLAAGCGGSGKKSGSVPEGASLAPKSSVGFVSLNSDFSSAQWQHVQALAARFPGTPQLVAALEKQLKGLDFDEDVKPALGSEVDIVLLGPTGKDVVGLTKPDTTTKLKLLLSKLVSKGETKAAITQIGDWVAIADKQAELDRFKAAAENGKLADDEDFKQGFEKLDSDSAARWWVSGDFAQSSLDRSLVSGGAAPRLTHDVGDLHAISGSAKAETDGVQADAYGLIEPTPDPATFSPSLPDEVPAGAVLYISSTNLAAPVRTILRLVGKSEPNFETQLSQIQGVLGLSLADDVYPLLKAESALAVYPGPLGPGNAPPLLFLQEVNDDQKAESLLKRVAAIAQLAGSIKVDTVPLANGKSMQRLEFTEAGVRVYDGVANGKLFVANSEGLGAQIVAGKPAKSLADEPLYRSARDAAGMPDRVAAFAYGDLKNGLPYVFQAAQRSGSTVPPEAFANVKPLHGTVVYLVKDDDALRISGFATIK